MAYEYLVNDKYIFKHMQQEKLPSTNLSFWDNAYSVVILEKNCTVA